VNLPGHGPDRLDFGAAWDGEKTIRTFSLTSNGKGYLGAEIPAIEILGPPETQPK
jgi:hypothetical protein